MTPKELAAMQQALEALESKLGETHPFAHSLENAAASRALREALDHSADTGKMVVPNGYALVSIDALKAWGKYDEVRNACQFPAEQAEQEPVAWLYDWEHEGEIVTGWVTQDFETTKFNNGHNVRPLYAAAPGRDIEEAVKAERQEISKKFWGAVNSCITTDELGIEFMNKFYLVHIFGHWLDRE